MNDDKDFLDPSIGDFESKENNEIFGEKSETGSYEDKSHEVCDEHMEEAFVEEKIKEEIKEEIEQEIVKNESNEPLTDFIMFSDPTPDKAAEAQMNSDTVPPQAPPPTYGGNGGYNQYTQNGYNPNVYQAPSAQPYQNSGWQQQPPQPPQPPQQQTQWTFNDYGPMQQAPQNKQKPPKKPKKPRSSGFGIKVFAVAISVMFVITIGSFAAYVVYDINKTPTNMVDNVDREDNSQSDTNSNSGKPSLNVGQTPDKSADTNKDGVLSGREINEKVSPSVVGVAVYAKTTGFQLAGQGSGIIMTNDGYVVTNAHVVSDQTNQVKIEKIEVILSDGNTYDAKIIGLDIKTDLAVLKISADTLTPAEFGDSDKLNIGDDVFVIGNPSGVEFAGSFTRGTVSSLSRSIYMQQLGAEIEYIQTDAAINPGNSGGAFINEYGQIVGISSAKISFEGYEGMGFAIPINNAKDIVNSLIDNGYVAGRPKIGIGYNEISKTISELNGIPHGLRVMSVEEDFDAFKQGVKVGDIIFKMGGKETYDAVTVAKALEGKKPGDKMVLSIYRVDENGRSSTFDITVALGEMVS